MASTHSISFIYILSVLVVLLQSRTGSLAPTHHLKIGVEGNIPTLIVTSAEIGITQKSEAADPTTNTRSGNVKSTTALPSLTSTVSLSAKWLHKTNQIKTKNKSLKSTYENKREKLSKEKSSSWQSKNIMVPSAQPILEKEVTKPMKSLKTASLPEKVTTESILIKTAPQGRKLSDIEATEKYRTKSLTTPSTFKYAKTTTTSSFRKQLETVKIGSITSSSITPGNLPHTTTKSYSNAKITVPLTTTSKPKKIISSTAIATAAVTEENMIITTPVSVPLSRRKVIDTAVDGNMKAKTLPQAVLQKIDSTTKTTTSTFAVKLTPSATPVITTEVNDVSNTGGTTLPIALTTTVDSIVGDDNAHYIREAKREPITITSSPISVMNTQASVNAKNLTTPTEVVTDKIAENSSAELTKNSQNLKSHHTQESDKAKIESETTTAQHVAIKLIDLEKHEPISVDELRTKGRTQNVDDGHDGIKQTKKKQLLDKHFVVDTIAQLDFEPSIDTSTLLPLSNENTAINDKAENFEVAQHNIEKPTFIAPTLTPIHNGYLGPIRMDERTISAQKENEKLKAHQHEASIESKLNDGRIVEIIAPTALLEQETTTKLGAIQPIVATEARPVKEEATVLSTTVFQVHEQTTSTTWKPTINANSNDTLDERSESKISDIQIEVYDSVAAPPKFKNDNIDAEHGTTRPPLLLPTTQERFTQYVVDRTEVSTPDTVLDTNLKFLGIGKPEPAAIEIHINVSEGMPNQNEELEFSYRQEENTDVFDKTESNSLPSKPQIALPNVQSDSENDRPDDILVVEIIDTGDNSTENQSPSSSSIQPIFTFRADSSAETGTSQTADELFMADLKGNSKPPILPPPPPPQVATIDRDSDTIFYISNTEVKVGESPPSSINSNLGDRREQVQRTRLENQFLSGGNNYMASTHPNKMSSQQLRPKHIYEEDIILSPIRNTADSLKIFRSQDDGAPPLDITYVGESVIEVEQSSGSGTVTTTASAIYATTTIAPAQSLPSSLPSHTPDVVIQPAMLPEMSIGVPVIGELPPQIELKEIDFMPNEANQQRSSVYETENNDIEENLSDGNNDVDRLVESSIQYGGDLIDEGADGGGGFDGIEGSYPLGNMATMHRRNKNNGAADYAHFTMHHGVNNLRKNELSVDVANIAGETTLGGMGGNKENGTTFQNGNDTTSTSMNITYAIAERIESNATAFSTAEQTEDILQPETRNKYGLFELLILGGALVLVSVVSIVGFYVTFKMQKRNGFAPDSESSELNLPNGSVAHCESGEPVSKDDESSMRMPKEDFPEHNSTNDKKCLSLPSPPDDGNFKKPSNNSNSFNIVNEKHVADSFVNKRSTDTVTRSIIVQEAKAKANGQCKNSVPDSYAGPNGSVTKMTLKNNHLIVETEERNDISRDARETKMHYTSDKDGVFVVEVARGADSKIIPESPIAELSEDHLFVKKPNINGNNNKSPTRKYEDEPAVLNNSHEQVQIHQPPTELNTSNVERSLHQIQEVEEEGLLSPKIETKIEMNFEENANTGLSQSDLSSTSSGDSNKRYSYGNQVLYTVEQTGYSSSSPLNVNVTPKKHSASTTIQDDDRTSENGHYSNETPEKSKDNEQLCQSEVKPEEKTQNDAMKQDENVEGLGEEENQIDSCMDVKESKVELEKEVEEEQLDSKAEGNHLGMEAAEIQQQSSSKNEMPASAEETSSNATENIPQIEIKEENMSVSDVEIENLAESITSDTTETTQKPIKPETPTSNEAEFESLVQAEAETDTEFAYDSLMSLPDPPSNDEMTQYSDFNGVETSQLDSLPPPPPALLADENTNMPDIVAEIKSKPLQMQSINGNVEYCTDSGNGSGRGNINGHEPSEQNRMQAVPVPLPPPILEEINSNRKIVPNSPLTPPESPPPSPPVHYSNGVIGMNEQICAASVHAVAVDVNGS